MKSSLSLFTIGSPIQNTKNSVISCAERTARKCTKIYCALVPFTTFQLPRRCHRGLSKVPNVSVQLVMIISSLFSSQRVLTKQMKKRIKRTLPVLFIQSTTKSALSNDQLQKSLLNCFYNCVVHDTNCLQVWLFRLQKWNFKKYHVTLASDLDVSLFEGVYKMAEL